MKNQKHFVLIAFLLAFQPALAQSPANAELREELLKMQVEDQAVRANTPETQDEMEKFIAIDAKNTARLKEIVSAHGWPSVSLVGDDGASAAWLLAQHADADPAFQRQVLALIEPLVETGEVKASNYAYLWDRTHDPQRYGTQGTCFANGQWEPREIEVPEEVDVRRAQVGLPPMAEYKKLVSTYCANGG